MKQKSTLLFAIGMLALSTTTTVFANNTNPATTTLTYKYLKQEQTAKKLVITGNVEVTLVQDVEAKKLYTNDGDSKVRVSSVDDVIYVSAKNNAAPAKVTVYVSNISRIDVSDEATVITKNSLQLKYLQVILKDKAKAEISSNTESLYTKLANESSLKLIGTSGSLGISTNDLASLNTNNFKSRKTEIEKRVLANFAKIN